MNAKRRWSGFVSITLLLTSVSGPSWAQGGGPVSTNAEGELILANQFGDLNGDGRVDVRDVVLLNGHLSGSFLLSPLQLPRADLNQDGKVTDSDRVALVNMILRLRVLANQDFDLDGLANSDEIRLGTKPLNPDSDGDGWPDGVEVSAGTDPLNSASKLITTVFAGPPITVEIPSTAGTSLAGGVLARPPLAVELMSSERTGSGPNLLLAKPPVRLELPNPVSAQGRVFLALPPLSLELPSLGGTPAASRPFLAMPPMEIELPSADRLNGNSLLLARPPLDITIPAP